MSRDDSLGKKTSSDTVFREKTRLCEKYGIQNHNVLNSHEKSFARNFRFVCNANVDSNASNAELALNRHIEKLHLSHEVSRVFISEFNKFEIMATITAKDLHDNVL